MITLAFDCSSQAISIALIENRNIIYEETSRSGLSHSETMLPAIDKALKAEKIKINNIDLFACTVGPGSFTGIRLAMSTLKGLILATSKPAAGVSTLAALALSTPYTEKLICVVMDAGRGQVYTSNYFYKGRDALQQTTKEKVINPHYLLLDIDEEAICVGEGAIKYKSIILKNKRKNIIVDTKISHIKASAVGILGVEKYKRGELLNPDTCIPFYLRSADARLSNSLYLNNEDKERNCF